MNPLSLPSPICHPRAAECRPYHPGVVSKAKQSKEYIAQNWIASSAMLPRNDRSALAVIASAAKQSMRKETADTDGMATAHILQIHPSLHFSRSYAFGQNDAPTPPITNSYQPHKNRNHKS
jgi:hypothetical protein